MDTAIGGVGQGGADVTSHYGETPEQAADGDDPAPSDGFY